MFSPVTPTSRPAEIFQSPRAIPKTSLRPFFRKVIEDKVNHTAMNIFRRIFHYIVDYLCTKFYTAYRSHLFALAPSRKMYKDIPIFDHTARQCVSIKKVPGLEENYICIDGKFVGFYDSTEEEKVEVFFNANSGTQLMFVEDTYQRSSSVTICEVREDDKTRTWNLNTKSKPTVICEIEHFLIDNPEHGQLLSRV